MDSLFFIFVIGLVGAILLVDGVQNVLVVEQVKQLVGGSKTKKG